MGSYAGLGSNQIFGGQGNDVIEAVGVNDLVLGNEGSDIILAVGFGGTETVYGGQGDDSIFALSDRDASDSISNALVFGGEGNDNIVVSGDGNNTIYGGTDSIGAGDGNNLIDLSGIASETEHGSAPRQRVFGGSGNDAVNAGSALDAVTITGAGGANQYAFAVNSDSTSVVGGAGSGLDQITDFISGTDKFYLSDENGDALNVNSVYGAGSQSGQANLTAAANAAILTASVQGANAATFSYGGSNYAVVDGGDGAGFSSGNDILINIAGTTSLTKNDFVGIAAAENTNPNVPFFPFG